MLQRGDLLSRCIPAGRAGPWIQDFFPFMKARDRVSTIIIPSCNHIPTTDYFYFPHRPSRVPLRWHRPCPGAPGPGTVQRRPVCLPAGEAPHLRTLPGSHAGHVPAAMRGCPRPGRLHTSPERSEALHGPAWPQPATPARNGNPGLCKQGKAGPSYTVWFLRLAVRVPSPAPAPAPLSATSTGRPGETGDGNGKGTS